MGADVMPEADYRSLGTCVAKHVGTEVEVVQADDRIAISLDLLRSPHSDALDVQGDGDLVVICGEYRYRSTGRVTRDGDPEYVLEARP